ncbi:UDP-N-acetylglucosamine-1-phosphate transferase [Nitrososphaera sp. AFS]|jgi:UDP-N-acetylglucosamine--dolichyl-phosphate N-acetylglucosaminephosphotransferase|uniref:UDP-N-acetylglucosamine-1-phosphate transferase n=1 Tax=Nitrososphaera sp. AFS TaxID=2301191 RepID=UPI001F3FF0F3|nr:UDP-N-acetylglucosamine-1-phosphate transferase [Nitrososphaera sp. AFS]
MGLMIDLSFGNYFFYGVVVTLISFLSVYLLTPRLITLLVSKGFVVQDYHKPGKPRIPRPAGPVLLLGLVGAEVFLYLFTLNAQILAILLTSVIAFLVGWIDDRKVMPGFFKPVALILAAIPLVVLGAHGTHLNLIFGDASIPLLYIPLIFIIIPVAGNTINSIDVLNGVASEAVITATIPLLVSIAVFGNTIVFIGGLSLFFGMIAFYKYHRFPSKIFPGDSGTLLIGAMYGALAIAGSSEIIGVIALLPSVMNSFLFLNSVKKIVEHREIKSRPTILMEDFRLMASRDKHAPTTLLRLILADGPLSEEGVGKRILQLAIYSSLLALLTIGIQYYFLSGVKHTILFP